MVSQAAGYFLGGTASGLPKLGSREWLEVANQELGEAGALTPEDARVVQDVVDTAELMRSYEQSPGIDKDLRLGEVSVGRLEHLNFDEDYYTEIRDARMSFDTEGEVDFFKAEVTEEGGFSRDVGYEKDLFDGTVTYSSGGMQVRVNSFVATLFVEPDGFHGEDRFF